MPIYLSNRDGNGKTSEEGHFHLQNNLLSGNVLGSAALAVSQNSPVGMSVIVAAGDYRIDTGLGYAYSGWNSANAVVSIATSDPANPRISKIVLYVDKAATTSASPPNNPGIAKLLSVDGVASATPTAPNDTVIQAAVGSGNPYIVLAEVYVNASETQIVNGHLTDYRQIISLSSLVSTSSIIDGSVTTPKLADSAVTTAKLDASSVTAAKIASGAAIKPTDIAMFSGLKTSNQTAVTTNAITVISWQTKQEYRNTSYFSTATGQFTAPANGWLDIAVTLSIISGDAADDSMNWGVYLNGSAARNVTDNWRHNSASTGIEFVTFMATGFNVTAGDVVDIRYNGTSFAVILMANACHVKGTFVPTY